MGRMIYKKWEKNYPKVAKKYTEDKCLKCAKVPKMPKVGRRRIQNTEDGRQHEKLELWNYGRME